MSSDIPPDVRVRAGPLLLGYVFNWGLYGALFVQVYMYCIAFPTDRRVLKTLVFGVFALDTVQTILVTHDLFQTFAIGWGSLEELSSVHLEWLATPIIHGMVATIVEMFYAYRIFRLSSSRAIALLITLIAIVQVASAITQGVQGVIAGDFTKLQTEAFASCAVMLVSAALCDIIIAITMSYYLSRHDSMFKSTHILINKLVRLAIETGSLTAAVAIIDLILFIVVPNANYYTTPALTLAKLYSNSLLLVLNSRMRLVVEKDDSKSSGFVELRFTTLDESESITGNDMDSAPTLCVSPAQNIGMHQNILADGLVDP